MHLSKCLANASVPIQGNIKIGHTHVEMLLENKDNKYDGIIKQYSLD